MTTDSRQCYVLLPRKGRWSPSRVECLTVRGLVQSKQPGHGLVPWSKPGWWAFANPAMAQSIADFEGVTVRELLCPGCKRRADALGVWP